ncbi:MAG: MFS transporter [Candidatus Eisenbacteria bacterium]|nr:MFS transporter [Candidatus Eisenbacteria bacterium]
MRIPGRILRIGATAFCTDFSVYLIWVAIPYKAIALGAGALYLGILPAIFSSTYIATTLISGRLSDRYSRIRLSRFGAWLFFAGCLIAMQAGTLLTLAILLPIIAVGIGFFWAPVQAALADEADLGALDRNVGFFNICWSVGKALGFLLGGSLYAFFGDRPSFLVAAGMMACVALILPAARPAPRFAPAEPDEVASSSAKRRGELPPSLVSVVTLRRFLYVAWIANSIGFGIGSTLNAHYPKFLLDVGLRSGSFGLILSAVFGVQTVSFLVLRRVGGWKFRRGPVLLVQAALAVSVGVLPWLRSLPLILLATIPIGVALGFAYHASITYSLMDHGSRGRRAGIHESLVGTGSFLLPLLGGMAASQSGDLRMPFWVCSVIILLASLAQLRIARPQTGA